MSLPRVALEYQRTEAPCGHLRDRGRTRPLRLSDLRRALLARIASDNAVAGAWSKGRGLCSRIDRRIVAVALMTWYSASSVHCAWLAT